MRTIPIPLCFAVLACFSGRADADHLTLPEVQVTSDRPPAALTQPDIYQTRIDLEQTPGGVSLVDMEQVREGRVSNFNDTLGLASGVLVQSRFGAEESRLSIRGSGLQRTFHGRGIKLMQDGIPVNLADGSFDFTTIDPFSTSHVEIFRGANAMQYGASQLGGSIDFIARTGYNSVPLEVRAEGGSFGYHRLGLAGGAVIGDRLDYFIAASSYRQDGFRDDARQGADRLNANIGYKISDQAETRFYFGYVNNGSELPSNLTKDQLKHDPEQSILRPGEGVNRRDIHLGRIANKTVLQWQTTRLELGAFYSRKDLYHPIIRLFPFAGDTTDVINQKSDDYGLSARLSHQGHLFGLGNEFIVGMSPSYGETDARNYQNLNAHRGQLINRMEQTASNLETFVENRLLLSPEWTLIAGVQHVHARRKSRDRLIRPQTGDQSVDRSYDQFNPRLGVLYQYRPSVQFFANVSRSFEPPSFGELNNRVADQLRAQSGTTFELGSRGNSAHIDWDIALYHSRLHNELLNVSTVPGFFSSTVNADKTTHDGLEMGLTARLPGNLEWRQNLLINRFRLDGDDAFGSRALPGIPKSLLRGELLYRHGGFYAGPTLELSPQRYAVDYAGTLYADSYTLLGWKMGQQYDEHWSWFVEGRNLTDRKYAATTGVTRTAAANEAIFLPGDGRSVYLGVQWRY